MGLHVEHYKTLDAALGGLLDRPPLRTIPGFGGVPPVQHREAQTRKRRRWVHPLDFLLSRDAISHGEYIGGVRFRSDFELACVTGEQTTAWSRLTDSVVKGRNSPNKRARRQPMVFHEPAIRRVDTREGLRKMAQTMTTFQFRLLVAVCVRGLHVAEVANEIHSSKVYVGRELREALGLAADYFNITIDCRSRD